MDTKKMTETLPPPFDVAEVFGSPDPFFETKKNEFLAAIYDGNGARTEAVYEQIFTAAAQKAGALGETEEKYLRQIQVAFKQFKVFLLSSTRLSGRYHDLQALIRKNVRLQSALPTHVAYATWKNRLNLAPWQEDLVFTTAVTFQLTSGCSNYCRRCNEWALPKIRSHFSREALEKILDRLTIFKNTDLALYGASDPLDWEDCPTDLRDILSDFTGNFSLLTKIPRGKQDLVKALLNMGISLSVSQTDRNRSRIEALEAQTNTPIAKQHASRDLLIPAGLDEDFISIKPSITDGYGSEITPEGVFLILPTFTSALHPFGHKKLPVTQATPFFPVKRLGRNALLVDYFKPLEVIGKDMRPFYLPRLLDVQVENLLLDNGSDALTPPGMRSLKEYFSIFEDVPRRRRKQMTPSVMARLKKEFLPAGGYGALSPKEKQVYRKRISAHLDFCKKDVVMESRVAALSFFLAAIAAFIDRQPVKARILAFLNRTETMGLQKKYGQTAARKKAISLFSPPLDVWEIFRFYATALVIGRQQDPIQEFIHSHPSAYDPSADRFVPVTCRN